MIVSKLAIPLLLITGSIFLAILNFWQMFYKKWNPLFHCVIFIPLIIYVLFFTWPGSLLFSAVFPAQHIWNISFKNHLYQFNGTGVFINKQDVLTNYHVVAPCTQVGIIEKDQFYPAHIIATSKANYQKPTSSTNPAIGKDIAVLRTQANKASFALFRTDALKEGETIISPNFSPWERGIFYKRNGSVDLIGANYFSFSAPARPGMSGSPVYDEEGNMVGLSHSIIKGYVLPNLNYGTHTSSLIPFLLDKHIPIFEKNSLTPSPSPQRYQNSFAVGIGCVMG